MSGTELPTPGVLTTSTVTNMAPEKPAVKKKVAKKRVAKKAVAPAAAPPVARTSHRYRARVWAIHHPYKNVRIPTHQTVELEPDNWLEVQVDAKVILDEGQV